MDTAILDDEELIVSHVATWGERRVTPTLFELSRVEGVCNPVVQAMEYMKIKENNKQRDKSIVAFIFGAIFCVTSALMVKDGAAFAGVGIMFIFVGLMKYRSRQRLPSRQPILTFYADVITYLMYTGIVRSDALIGMNEQELKERAKPALISLAKRTIIARRLPASLSADIEAGERSREFDELIKQFQRLSVASGAWHKYFDVAERELSESAA